MDRLSKLALSVACATLVSGISPVASGASLYWDTNSVATDASYGGDGTWSTGASNWNSSATIGSGTLSSWNNSASPLDGAVFLRGTSGAVAVSGTVNVGAVSIGTNVGSFTTGTTSYTLTGGTIDARVASFGTVINHNNGSNTIDSAFGLFGGVSTGVTNRQRFNMLGGSLTLSNLQDISGVTGTHELSLEGWGGGPLNINNLTKSSGSAGMTLLAGGQTTKNDYVYSLGGNNTGLTGAVTLNRGIVSLNNNNALAGATGITVANANNTSTGDTANVVIGTSGVTIAKPITVNALTSADTADVRQIGGTNTTGTATFSGGITLNAVSTSGVKIELTAASGGTVDFSNAITDGANTVPISKIGLGTVRLTLAAGNTYDGGTTVSAGTLIVNNTSNSGTGTGNVVVGAAGTLGGTGIINPADGNTVTVNGKIAPGEGVGTLTVGSTGSTNDVAFGASSQYLAEVTGDAKDLLAINGDVTLAGTLDVTFSGTQTATRYVLATYTGSRGGTQFTNLTVHGSALSWQMDYSVPGQIAVAVPEPASIALLGVAGLFLRRRR